MVMYGTVDALWSLARSAKPHLEGDKIVQGSKIGLAGHTGRTTGPHVHLSIHVPGGMVDPASFIKLPIYPRVMTPSPSRS